MRIQQIPLYLHTVRFLTLQQIVYRSKYSLANRDPLKKLGFSMVSFEPGTGFRGIQPIGEWLTREMIDAGQIRRRTFRFLNREATFFNGIQWVAANRDRLWTYNLHYFDYLLAAGGLDTAEGLLKDWMACNPPGAPDAWDPFPTSLRIVNWLKYASLANDRLPEEAVASLWNQCRWLERFLEYHLLGNHLFKNGKALVFAGIAFGGRDAARWLAKGLQIVEEQVAEQILDDGGHFERSPMYHSMIFEDVLDLLNILPRGKKWIGLRKQLGGAADRMVGFLDAMTHPDGGIALFNDAALNIEASPQDLLGYYRRVTGNDFKSRRTGLTALAASGYFVLAPTEKNRMIIDCGAVGPDYQPGHSHCDTLSFELSLDGRRVVVDSGCCQYEDGAIRRYNRGNRGHNTLTLDGWNQSEVWGAHRCARRAYPIDPRLIKDEKGSLVFEGAHDGYLRLRGKPIHRRRVQWQGARILIEDQVQGNGRYDVESRLHLHPDLTAVFDDGRVIVREGDRLIVAVTTAGSGTIITEQGWYCPEFGLKHECSVLVLKFQRAALPLKTGWIFDLTV